MSKRSATILVDDIWDAIERIERYTQALTQDGFVDDDKTSDAVVRNLEIIGEAANRLPEEFVTKYSEIEWPKIVGLRHRIVHDYFGVDLNIIWEILQKDLPALKKSLHVIRKDFT